MSRLILRHATLLDGLNPPRPEMTLVIDGERLHSVDSGQVEAAPGDQVFDLKGMTVMPGMINTHYHATYQDIGPGALPVGMEAPPALQTLRAARNLKRALDAGFTGVISAGAPYAIDAGCKQAIAEGLMEGPRIVAGSRDVSTTGHCQDWWQWHWGPGSSAQTHIVDGPDAFRRAIREEVKRGAEIIKIFATAGHAVPGVVGKMDLDEDELRTAIDTAHSRGARIRAHIANRETILTAARLGIDVIDHADGLDEECIAAVLAKGIFVVPSMLYVSRVVEYFSGEWKSHHQQELEKMHRILPIANGAGVKLTLGDDFGALPLSHGSYADELEYYVNEVGIPPLDVIRWATVHGAEMMGMGHELGQLKPRFLADLVIVDGDPLVDISCIKGDRGLKGVVKGGRFVHHQLGPGGSA